MENPRFLRWAGAAGILGGALWIVSTVIHALKPVGCVADECAVRPMRQAGALEGIMTLTSLLLFSVAAIALIALVSRAGRFGWPARAGTIMCFAGIATLIAAGLIQALVFEGDFPLMPYFVVPGVAALLIGLLMLTVTVLAAGVLPRWVTASLLIGVLAMTGFNEQTNAAWLAVPFGLAWIAVGYSLWSLNP